MAGTWSPEQRARFAATMVKKRKSRSKGEMIPLDAIPERPVARGRSRPTADLPKHTDREQLAHELIVAVTKILEGK